MATFHDACSPAMTATIGSASGASSAASAPPPAASDAGACAYVGAAASTRCAKTRWRGETSTRVSSKTAAAKPARTSAESTRCSRSPRKEVRSDSPTREVRACSTTSTASTPKHS